MGSCTRWKCRNIVLLFCNLLVHSFGLAGGSDSKESACNAGDLGSILGWEDPPGEGTGNPLQYSGLENSMDRGGWWATVCGVAETKT